MERWLAFLGVRLCETEGRDMLECREPALIYGNQQPTLPLYTSEDAGASTAKNNGVVANKLKISLLNLFRSKHILAVDSSENCWKRSKQFGRTSPSWALFTHSSAKQKSAPVFLWGTFPLSNSESLVLNLEPW